MPWIDSKGYRSLLHEGREVREHRLVAERLLGRPLARHETVHHLNGDKLDNRPENLEVVSRADHTRIHWEEGAQRERVARQTFPDAVCSECDWFGRLYAKGLCRRCYMRHAQARYMRRKRGQSA